MAATTLAEQIQNQEKAISDSKKRIANLKKKAVEKQSKRFLKAAEKAGLFLVEVTDENLAMAMENLAKTADSPQAQQDEVLVVEQSDNPDDGQKSGGLLSSLTGKK